ncbi:MAG: response regulator [Bacteroidetes bacterium]|nr:response regulator [Bacteroidota bacterium]
MSSTKQLNSKRFRNRIILIMGAVFALVSFTSYSAFHRFSMLLGQMEEVSRPNDYLITLRALVSDVNNAENQVKSFRLTEDTVFVRTFYESISRIDDHLSSLEALNPDSSKTRQTDSLSSLINQKFDVLDDLMSATSIYRTQEALSQAMKVLPLTVDSKEHTGILGKLFRKKETVPTAQVSVVANQLEDIREAEQRREQDVKRTEKLLIERDALISSSLDKYYRELEHQEVMMGLQKQSSAQQLVQESKQLLALSVISSAVLFILMVFFVLQFIRANNRYRQTLKHSKKEAEKLAKAKERFVANISHEIRTPMHAISGFVEQLSATKLDREQSKQVTILQRSSAHLIHLLNDVLDLSKIQAGKFTLDVEPFDIRETIQDVSELIKGMIKSEDIEFSVQVEPSVPIWVEGDKHRLKQVLLNLLSNALKFTKSGTVELLVNAKNDEVIQFEVRDTGIGIRLEELEHLFEDFEQANTKISGSYGGTGLGLSIVKHIVELQDGSIDVRSKLGEGTSIQINLPFKEVAPQARPATPEMAINPDIRLNGVRLIVADDEPYNRKLIHAMLNKHGCVLDEVENGKEVIALLTKHPQTYQGILMDVHMPEMDGLSATRTIRSLANPVDSQIPILLLTAAVTQEERAEYLKSGANGLLSKPFAASELIHQLQGTADVNSQPVDVQKVQPAQERVNFSRLKELSGHDHEFYKDMLMTFVSGTTSGFQALLKALEQQDTTTLKNKAHQMCSPCRHLQAHVLYQQLKSIEEYTGVDMEITDLRQRIVDAQNEFNQIRPLIDKELQDKE